MIMKSKIRNIALVSSVYGVVVGYLGSDPTPIAAAMFILLGIAELGKN